MRANDAPVLKVADLEIAMGPDSQLTKETAKRVIVNNNISIEKNLFSKKNIFH